MAKPLCWSVGQGCIQVQHYKAKSGAKASDITASGRALSTTMENEVGARLFEPLHSSILLCEGS